MKRALAFTLSLFISTSLFGFSSQAGIFDKLKKGVEGAAKGIELPNLQPSGSKKEPKPSSQKPVAASAGTTVDCQLTRIDANMNEKNCFIIRARKLSNKFFNKYRGVVVFGYQVSDSVLYKGRKLILDYESFNSSTRRYIRSIHALHAFAFDDKNEADRYVPGGMKVGYRETIRRTCADPSYYYCKSEVDRLRRNLEDAEKNYSTATTSIDAVVNSKISVVNARLEEERRAREKYQGVLGDVFASCMSQGSGGNLKTCSCVVDEMKRGRSEFSWRLRGKTENISINWTADKLERLNTKYGYGGVLEAVALGRKDKDNLGRDLAIVEEYCFRKY
jgi:hypothetical protein